MSQQAARADYDGVGHARTGVSARQAGRQCQTDALFDGYRIRLTIPGDLPALTGLLQAVA